MSDRSGRAVNIPGACFHDMAWFTRMPLSDGGARYVQVQENGLHTTKYTCDLPEAVVQQLATDLALDLTTYVQ